MSKELRWCKSFIRCVDLRSHKRKRIYKKNGHRAKKMLDKALKKWSHVPYPPEWQQKVAHITIAWVQE